MVLSFFIKVFFYPCHILITCIVFLPALAKREGAKIIAMNVNHRKRLDGASNYTNLGRLLVGIFDILGVMWLIKRSPKILIQREKNNNRYPNGINIIFINKN